MEKGIIMLFTQEFLDSLTAQAKENPRLRVNYDLRNSEADTSQRMLNALCPGTIVPIHRHPDTSEVMVVVRGCVREHFYDSDGKLMESFFLKAGEDCLINIPAGQFHSLECMEEGTIIFETKDGAYAPLVREDIIEI